MSRPKHIKIHPRDNVVVVLEDIVSGESITDNIVSHGFVPGGQKMAVEEIARGQAVFKYGQVIGVATNTIHAGDHVHTHNLQMCPPEKSLPQEITTSSAQDQSKDLTKTFKGILRPNGRVGTRNYIGILSSVNCSASVSRMIADYFSNERLQEFEHIDGVVAITHGQGCGDSEDNQGFRNLQRCLTGFAHHPNFGAVVIVGLGCEVLQIDSFAEELLVKSGLQIKTLDIQKLGGTQNTVEKGLQTVQEILPKASAVKRQSLPVSHITVGLECGGSDAYSGISANPALGAAVDLLVTNGATAILAETTEIYGTERFLAERAISQEVGRKILDCVRWWENHTRQNNSEIDNNPSPGNKAGGLTTILEKALGAVAKGGSSPLMDVVPYASPVRSKGLVFMDTPGYDPVSITGMVAGGANMICFTTGRGSVLGCKPVPVIKIASNTKMFNHMQGDMDINAGRVVKGEVTIQEMGRSIYEMIIDTASGRQTKSEMQGIGDFEFVPWHIGAVL